MADELARIVELARGSESLSGLPADDERLVITYVAALFGNTNTYGKKWAPAIAQGWLMALRMAPDVSAAELKTALCRWLADVADFPAPSQVIAWIREQRVDLEKLERMRQWAIELKEFEDGERRARNVERYGVEEPTREQVDARLKRLGLSMEAWFETD